jgi:hypothetical protein
MTRSQLLERLEALRQISESAPIDTADLLEPGLDARGDPAAAHHEADLALLDFIDDPEITMAWSRIRKWWA